MALLINREMQKEREDLLSHAREISVKKLKLTVSAPWFDGNTARLTKGTRIG